MKFTFELRYNRIMDQPKPTLNKWKQNVADLLEALNDPGFQRALEHPNFKDALAKVVKNNSRVLVTGGSTDILALVEVINNLGINFFVKEDDDRLFIDDNDGNSVWRDGKFVEVDDDGVEMG